VLDLLRFPSIAVTNSDDTFWMPFSITSRGLPHRTVTTSGISEFEGNRIFLLVNVIGVHLPMRGVVKGEFEYRPTC
jgi:hypothetical protein